MKTLTVDTLPEHKIIRSLWYAWQAPELGRHRVSLENCTDPLVAEAYQAIQDGPAALMRLAEEDGPAAWLLDYVYAFSPPAALLDLLKEKREQRIAAGLPDEFFSQTQQTAVMQLPDLDPGRGSWPVETSHTCKTGDGGDDETGAIITIRGQQTAVSPIFTPAWRASEKRPACRGCQHRRTKREARKVLHELARLDGRLWGVWMADEAEYQRFAARTRQRRKLKGIEGGYTAYPTSDGRFYVIHDQEGEGGVVIPGDRTEAFNLLDAIANDTPDERRISTSAGWGGPWQGTKGDGRVKQAKRMGDDVSPAFQAWSDEPAAKIVAVLGGKSSDTAKSHTLKIKPGEAFRRLAESGIALYCRESNQTSLSEFLSRFPGLDVAVGKNGLLTLISEAEDAIGALITDKGQGKIQDIPCPLSVIEPAADPPETAVEEASHLRLDLLQASFGGLR